MEACCPPPPLPLAGVFPGLPVTSSPQVVIGVMATEMIKHQEGGGGVETMWRIVVPHSSPPSATRTL